MGRYTRTSPSDGAVITASYVDGQLAAIETAHNTHETGDFPANCVPVIALVNDLADFVIPLYHHSAVGNSQAYTTTRTEGFGYTPMACTLVAVTAICGGSYASACALKLYYDGAAASNAMTLTANGTGVIDSSPPTTALSAQKKLEIRAETDATGDAAAITMYLHCKKQLVA